MNKNIKAKHIKTDRGYDLINFEDAYGSKCSLQQSSIVGDCVGSIDCPGSSALWLGVDNIRKPSCSDKFDSGNPRGTRMHLSKEQVAWLIGKLSHWLANGNLDG